MGEFVKITGGSTVKVTNTLGSIMYKFKDIAMLFNNKIYSKYNTNYEITEPNLVVYLYNSTNNTGLVNNIKVPDFINANGIDWNKVYYKFTTLDNDQDVVDKVVYANKVKEQGLSFIQQQSIMNSIYLYIEQNKLIGAFDSICISLFDLEDDYTFNIQSSICENAIYGIRYTNNIIINNTGKFNIKTDSYINNTNYGDYNYEYNSIETDDYVFITKDSTTIRRYKKSDDTFSDVIVSSLSFVDSSTNSFYKNGNYIYCKSNSIVKLINIDTLEITDTTETVNNGIQMFGKDKYIKKWFIGYIVSSTLDFSTIDKIFMKKCNELSTDINECYVSQNDLMLQYNDCTPILGYLKISETVSIGEDTTLRMYIEDMVY